MGQARLFQTNNSNRPPIWVFDSYLSEGATDFEHDSAFALRMGLVGVEFRSVYYGHSEIIAVIDPQGFDDFCVPPVGYNPMKDPDAVQCEDAMCKKHEPHIIVPEGNYTPPRSADLFKMVRGRFVEITFGVPPKEE